MEIFRNNQRGWDKILLHCPNLLREGPFEVPLVKFVSSQSLNLQRILCTEVPRTNERYALLQDTSEPSEGLSLTKKNRTHHLPCNQRRALQSIFVPA